MKLNSSLVARTLRWEDFQIPSFIFDKTPRTHLQITGSNHALLASLGRVSPTVAKSSHILIVTAILYAFCKTQCLQCLSIECFNPKASVHEALSSRNLLSYSRLSPLLYAVYSQP